MTEIKGKHVFGTPQSRQTWKAKVHGFLVDALRVPPGEDDGDPSALRFVGKSGKSLYYDAWRTWCFDSAVEAAKLKGVTPHDLRASHASWVAGKHGIMAVARRLGHASASVTTRHYARAVEGKDDEIADVFDDARTERSGTPKDDDDGEMQGSPMPPMPAAVAKQTTAKRPGDGVIQYEERRNRLAEHASELADVALANIVREYLHVMLYTMSGPEDRPRPRDAHPAFYGSFDWHSCVQMHWLLVCLLRTAPEPPDARYRRRLQPCHRPDAHERP